MSTTPRTALTRAIIEGAQPAEKPYRIHDAKLPGLFLRVQPSGVKSWNVLWTRTTSKSLGLYPIVTLDMARERARKALVERDEHGAPLAVRSAPAGADTLLRDFIAERYAPWLRANRKHAEADLAEIKAQFESAFYALPIGEISVGRVEAWTAKRFAGGAARSTVRRILVRLKAMLSKAVEWEALPVSPLAKLKLGKDSHEGVVRYLSADEEKALRAALAVRDVESAKERTSANTWRVARDIEPFPEIAAYGDHLTPLVLLAMNTGARRGELTALMWSDVNLTSKVLTIRASNAKSGKARHIPLNSEAVATLMRWRDEPSRVDDVRLFPIRSPKTAWNALLETAGIAKFRFHDLRHHFASRLVMAGVDLNTVRDLLGHRDLTMTLRYAHLAPEHRAAAVEVLVRAGV